MVTLGLSSLSTQARALARPRHPMQRWHLPNNALARPQVAQAPAKPCPNYLMHSADNVLTCSRACCRAASSSRSMRRRAASCSARSWARRASAAAWAASSAARAAARWAWAWTYAAVGEDKAHRPWWSSTYQQVEDGLRCATSQSISIEALVCCTHLSGYWSPSTQPPGRWLRKQPVGPLALPTDAGPRPEPWPLPGAPGPAGVL